MLVGPLPAVANFGTWTENIEFLSMDDNTPLDFSLVDEVKIIVEDQYTRRADMTLTMTAGDVVSPAPGIIQWTVASERMGGLRPSVYDIKIIVTAEGQVVPMFLGTVEIRG